MPKRRSREASSVPHATLKRKTVNEVTRPVIAMYNRAMTPQPHVSHCASSEYLYSNILHILAVSQILCVQKPL